MKKSKIVASAPSATRRPAAFAGKEVATPPKAALPAHLDDIEMTGQGVSTDSADMMIPMINVLQGLSPQVMEGSPAYMDGAKPGLFYMKNAPVQLLDGKKGFLFQPCHFSKGWVEWLPRNKGGGGGGGFVALHKDKPADTIESVSPENPDKKILIRSGNKNVMAETRYHAGYIIGEDGTPLPAVIPFTSTGHTTSRNWMFLMAQKRNKGQKVDSWAIYYRVKTQVKTKGQFTYYVMEVTDAGPADETKQPTTMWVPTKEDYLRGKALNEGISSGARTFDVQNQDEGGAASETDDGKM